MVITCFHHSWSWSSKLVQFESGDGLTGNEMIQSEYRLVAMACAYFLEKQRKKVKPNLKLMALLDLHMNHGSRCWAIPCCYVDCMKCFKVQGKFIIPCSSKQQCHPALTPHNGIQNGTTSRLSKCVKTTPAYCIQQWHAIGIHQWHPAMAPSNGAPPHGTQQWHLTMAPSIQQWRPAMAPSIQQWHPPWHPAMAPYHSTQQWHHVQSVKSVITTPRLLHPAMAPSNGTLPHGAQQWHLTMAPSNGTTSSLSKCVITTPRLLHPAMAAAMAPSTQQWHLTTWHPPWHPAMAPYHGTQQWHRSPAMAPSNGTQQRHRIQSANLYTPLSPAMAAQQWHPAMAASNGTTSNPPTCTPTPPVPSNGTQQWQPATATTSNPPTCTPTPPLKSGTDVLH